MSCVVSHWHFMYCTVRLQDLSLILTESISGFVLVWDDPTHVFMAVNWTLS